MDEAVRMAAKESAAMARLRRFRDDAAGLAVSSSFSSGTKREIVVKVDH